jgi:hypothetical protein
MHPQKISINERFQSIRGKTARSISKDWKKGKMT